MNLVERIASVQQEIKEQQEENAKEIKKIALNQQENANEIKAVKKLLASNSSALQEVVNVVKRIASNQEKKSEEIRENLRDVKGLQASNKPCDCQSAGVPRYFSEYLV